LLSRAARFERQAAFKPIPSDQARRGLDTLCATGGTSGCSDGDTSWVKLVADALLVGQCTGGPCNICEAGGAPDADN
jgi:hypothetical protein